MSIGVSIALINAAHVGLRAALVTATLVRSGVRASNAAVAYLANGPRLTGTGIAPAGHPG